MKSIRFYLTHYLKMRKFRKREGVPDGWVPIREVIAKAGVTKATVHHYVKLGLIPKPLKVNRQMAYYPPETVEYIKVIKKLQKGYLPLKKIKELIKKRRPEEIQKDIELIRKSIEEEMVPEKKLRAMIPISERVLRQLEQMGIIKKSRGGYTKQDIKIIENVWRLTEIGFNEQNSFSIDFFDKLAKLVGKIVALELKEFNKKLLGKLPPEKLAEIAREAIPATSEIIGTLHAKILQEKIKELELPKTRAEKK